jgi:carbon-monoxide dehydrogenase iron sulfur subunit
MKIFTLDPERCTGCRLCELACSFKKHRVFNRELSDIRVETREELALNVPIKCMQCDDPPCVKACFAQALYKDEKTGAVLLASDRCILCKACIVACPFGCISLVSRNGALQISLCDLCSGQPECIGMCRSGAISYEDEKNINKKKMGITFSKLVGG